MNLYFRLLLTLLRSLFASKIGLLDVSRLKFRAWPLDCDINLHLTNSRYLALCDLSRTYLLSQTGVLSKLIKQKWLPIAQAQEISYFKPINPFQRFEILTRLTFWDDKYWYTEHQFMVKEKLCAVLQVRGVCVHRRAVVPFQKIVGLVDDKAVVPAKPVTVDNWQKLIESKKR
jgi:acyl-CoA thioesterase FadM